MVTATLVCSSSVCSSQYSHETCYDDMHCTSTSPSCLRLERVSLPFDRLNEKLGLYPCEQAFYWRNSFYIAATVGYLAQLFPNKFAYVVAGLIGIIIQTSIMTFFHDHGVPLANPNIKSSALEGLSPP